LFYLYQIETLQNYKDEVSRIRHKKFFHSIFSDLFLKVNVLLSKFQVVAILKGHAKKVNRVVYHTTEDVVITASHDATIRIWDVPTSQTLKLMRIHDGPVTGLSLHATGDYILSTSTDQVSFKNFVLKSTFPAKETKRS
jgi:WD40 repeat protein